MKHLFFRVFTGALLFSSTFLGETSEADEEEYLPAREARNTPTSFYEEIINLSTPRGDKKGKKQIVCGGKGGSLFDNSMARGAKLHAFEDIRDAQKYNKIIAREFFRIRRKISWREFSAEDILFKISKEEKTEQFLKDKIPLEIFENEEWDVVKTMPGETVRIKFDEEYMYIAGKEWILARDPHQSPHDYPLHWLPGCDFSILTKSDDWKKEKTSPVPLQGFRDPFKAKLLGDFLAVKSLRLAEEKTVKEKLRTLKKKAGTREAQQMLCDVCATIYDSQHQKFIKKLTAGSIEIAIGIEAEPPVTVPTGTRLRPVESGSEDDILWVLSASETKANPVYSIEDYGEEGEEEVHPAETLLAGEVNGETVYVSVVDYVLMRLANDKPTGAKGDKKKKDNKKK